jgi:hypothetical protein
MPVKCCEVCGKSFTQGRGRPSKRCPAHRAGGGKYGGAHRKLVAVTKDQAWGSPCARCGRVLMYGQEIHLDHLDGGGPADYRGWAHAHCNTSAGASKGNRMRGPLNGRPMAWSPPPPSAPPAVASPIPPGPDPSIRHSPDCACGGSLFYPGPGKWWTSRCW